MLLPILVSTHLLVASSTLADARHVKDGTISVDGAAEDEGWSHLAWTDGFIQQDPNENALPSERTRVKSAYDDDAVYFLVEALDSKPDRITGRLTRRDELSASDWIHVWLDTFDDGRSAYRFSVNPAEVKQDARVSDDLEDLNWNGVWEVRTQTSSAGWVAEFKIPFNQLRYDKQHGHWGFQVGRDLSRLGEKSYLSKTPRGATTIVRHFATLEGLDQLPNSWSLALEPYGLGGLEVDRGDPGFTGTLGGEARLALGSMNLALTVNPDFGQVESDPSVLNLSANEIYFEEKRGFFLEGKELLDYKFGFGDGDLGRYTLFYTRRIGRGPTGGADLGGGEEITDSSKTTPILGAVKLTGKSTDGWTIGVLDALTGNVDGTISGGEGGEHERTLEPLANAAVVRIAKEFDGGRTKTGVMATHLIRRPDDDTNSELIAQAYSGGADIDHRIGDYQILARALGTHLTGTPEAIEKVQRNQVHYYQRSDAPHLRVDPDAESLSGWSASLIGGKTSGTDWRGVGGVVVASPGFDPNPLGYFPRSDTQYAFAWFQYREDTPGPMYRNYNVNFNAWAQRTFGSEFNLAGGNATLNWTFPNTGTAYLGGGRDTPGKSVNALFGGPGLKRPGWWYGWAGGSTDERSPVSLMGEFYTGTGEDHGGWNVGIYFLLKIRPTSAIEISFEPNVERRIYDYQFVDEVEGASIIGHLWQTTATLAFRTNWTITPELSLQIYASPYLTRGTYTNFREVVAPSADRYVDRFAPYDYQGSDKFGFLELRSNVVVRWEYLLGSTLFVVWSHEHTLSDDLHGTLNLGRDLGDVVSWKDSVDTVLVKLSYWLAI